MCQEQTNQRIKKMINEAEWINEEKKETLNDREKFIQLTSFIVHRDL